jgi:hypothetical protein
MKKTYKVILGFIILAVIVFFVMYKKEEIKSLVKKYSTSSNTCSGVNSEVQAILDKNNIDLSRLNKIGDYESGSKLSYAELSTGYTYEVVKNDLSIIHKGWAHPRSRMIAFKVCYNNIVVITRDLRLSFLDDDVYQSAFDFDFSPIEIDPTPTISLDKAKEIAYRSQSALKGVNPILGYYDLNTGKGNMPKNYILAWGFDNGATVIVNAKTGEIVSSFSGVIID